MKYLTAAQLAKRWGCSVHTLANWRWLGKGPDFKHLMKRGNPVVYPLSAVIRWEKKNK